MKPTVSQYARTLMELSQEASSTDREEIARGFLGLLRQRKETKKWPLILKKMEVLEARAKGALPMTVTTARSLSENDRQEITKIAERLFEAGKAELEYVVDESIKGGAVFQTDEHMIDASVSGKLKRLHQALLQ